MFFAERLFVLQIGQVDVAAQVVRGAGDELVLALHRGDLLEHGLALVRVDAEAADHVEEAVGVDVLLVRMATEDELQLGGGDELAHDVLRMLSPRCLRRRRNSRSPCG
jgi:hypothetical protein